MCGISGFFAFKPQSAEMLRAMNTLVRHRGPDDEGYVIFSGLNEPALILGGEETASDCYTFDLPYTPKHDLTGDEQIMLGLGHRRLSIIDLAVTGHQPMCYSSGQYWIVYNGEIYNYIELKEELKNLGYSFTSQSDTEVILASWECWGEKALNRFNGMFSFALYDRKNQILSFVRDRFGIKPLYYWVSPAGFVAFASEIKQFTILPGWDPRLNGQLAYDFLIWGLLDHTKETLFSGVYQIRPGNLIRIDLKRLVEDEHRLHPNEPLKTEPWYELKPSAFEGTIEEAAGKFYDIFYDAVRLRLRSDVPIGSCLSGGLDSSSISCLLNRLLRASSSNILQKSFSACAYEKQFDEREYIDEVVRSTGLDAYYIYPSLDDLFKALKNILWYQDEPFGSTSIYAQWNVFDLASRHGVKVMLDGQGADEYLAGYHTFFAVRQASLLRRLRFISYLSDVNATSRLHNYTVFKSARDTASLLLPAWQRKLISNVFQGSELDPSWLDLHRIGAQVTNPHSSDGKKPRSVLELSLSQLSSTSLPMLLHWEDRNSMSHSIEARVPFLDYRLVEFTLGLPEDYKLENGITKRVLREAMRGILPEKIRLRRDKLGFVTPEQTWVKNQNPHQFKLMLRDAIENSHGVLTDSANLVLDEMIEGRRPFSFLVWRLICFGKWLQQFNISI
jgi:asparagine synthase (glutamine-hydrolysing)